MKIIETVAKEVIHILQTQEVSRTLTIECGDPHHFVTDVFYFKAISGCLNVQLDVIFTRCSDMTDSTDYDLQISFCDNPNHRWNFFIRDEPNQLLFELMDLVSEGTDYPNQGSNFKQYLTDKLEFAESRMNNFEESPFSEEEQYNFDNAWEEAQCK
jgi:hypothetical protein